MTYHEALIDRMRSSSIFNRGQINEGLNRNEKTPAEVELETLEDEKLHSIVELLWDEHINDLVHEGKLTLAAIKPNTQDSRLGVETDDKGAELLESMIPEELEIVFSVSVVMNDRDVEAFYGKELIEELRQRKMEDGRSVWDVYSTIMTAGPTTFMLLYHDNAQLYDDQKEFIDGNNAVQIWRNRMGPTNNQKARDEFPESIRGKYAVATEKNLVHGSDGMVDLPDGKKYFSVEALRENVGREVEWLRNHLTNRLLKKEGVLSDVGRE